MDVLFIDAVVQ